MVAYIFFLILHLRFRLLLSLFLKSLFIYQLHYSFSFSSFFFNSTFFSILFKTIHAILSIHAPTSFTNKKNQIK